MTVSDIQRLYDYNYWANHRLRSIAETLSHEQYTKDLGSSHGGIHGTLVHIMGAEEIWLKRWQGRVQQVSIKLKNFHRLMLSGTAGIWWNTK